MPNILTVRVFRQSRRKVDDVLRRVLSPKDAREWEAREFSAKDPEWRKRRRGQLLCLGCGKRATLKMGAGVREPFFAARHNACGPLVQRRWRVFSLPTIGHSGTALRASVAGLLLQPGPTVRPGPCCRPGIGYGAPLWISMLGKCLDRRNQPDSTWWKSHRGQMKISVDR
jgi:hypothetical protein